MSKLFIRVLICWLFIFPLSKSASSQVTIAGPACVIPSTEYQYILDANWVDSSEIHLCVQGGIISSDTIITCYDGAPLSFVRIIWNDSIENGLINLTSLNGNASFNINLTTVLDGGKIDSSALTQALDSAAIPSTITCSDATGGNCSPVYTYQWQQSTGTANYLLPPKSY